MDNNELKHLISGYIGIQSLDEYDIKVFILKEIDNYIKEYIKENNIDVNYDELFDIVNKEYSLRTKLQDSLDLLPIVNGSIELMLILNKKLKELDG